MSAAFKIKIINYLEVLVVSFNKVNVLQIKQDIKKKNPVFGVLAYQPGASDLIEVLYNADAYEDVCSFVFDTTEEKTSEILERIFTLGNDERFVNDSTLNTSISTGDIIKLNDMHYIVMPEGFESIIL